MDGRDAEWAVGFPWPPAEHASTLDALGRTWSGSVLRPASFFRAMPPSIPLTDAISFHVVCTLAGAGAELFWRMTLPPRGAWSEAGDPLLEFVLAVPLGLLATACVAVLLHAALFTLGATRHGAGATARMLLFTAGPSVFLVIPRVGAGVAMVWWLVLTVVGLREVHGATTGRAGAAVALVVFGLVFATATLLLAGLLLGLLAAEAPGWSWS